MRAIDEGGAIEADRGRALTCGADALRGVITLRGRIRRAMRLWVVTFVLTLLGSAIKVLTASTSVIFTRGGKVNIKVSSKRMKAADESKAKGLKG